MFHDRAEAGRVLGRLVAERVQDSPVVVLALPRGGIPVGVEVAKHLAGEVEFDVFLVRKLGVPHHEELAFGAIATGGVRVLNQTVIEEMALSPQDIERIAKREQIELDRREKAYRRGRSAIALRDTVAILVDDGLATGASMIAAVRAARQQNPKRIVVAVPVASAQAYNDLGAIADEIICAEVPPLFYAVGYWYENFDQVTDAEVRDQLQRFTAAGAAANKPYPVL